MPEKSKSHITFGAQMGDTNADAAVGPHLIALRRLLDKCCKGPYSNDIDEFAPIARVDGDLWHFNFEGVERVRWSRKGRYITADIGVTRRQWEGVGPIGIRQCLMTALKAALAEMVKKLKNGKAAVDADRLTECLSKVETEFLGEKGLRN
jgi:hypothetical protein